MLEILHFIFQDAWHFFGAWALLYTIVSSIVLAIKSFPRFVISKDVINYHNNQNETN